ncbi:magnesium transporter [Rubritalea squalenifaciens DSM 18772]|uniref:Magnesium transporter MgtE n=2 Tax=Rubritalea TaxID=361050 RepID=A0A1M6PYB8_9BACT|nr:magnesium transporter [Rubritalea squalenifaciens]SHK12912.1 magnesium transporter [Rubritalea squalenifaciens DSM 18772]
MPEDNEIKRLLLEATENRNAEEFHRLAEQLHYADLADCYEDLSEEDRDFFTETLGAEAFADVMAELPESLIEETIERFDQDEQREMLDQMSDDDRVDMLQDVSDDTRRRLLDLVEPDDIEITKSLLKYDEDTAGGRMTTHFGRVRVGMNVKQALDSLRAKHEETESLARIYVVDSKGRLVGLLRFRDLAFNTWDTPIEDIVRPYEHCILATADQEEAAQMFSKYDLIVLPVVDEYDRLLGIITHDDALEIIEEESTEDMERMAGFSGDVSEETYLNTRTLTHFKRRFPWLFGLAIMAIASGIVMLSFESVLNKLFILSLFLPMVVAAGGNTGGQASTMVIRAMALGELEPGTTMRVALKELRLGLLLGSLLGIGMALITVFVVPMFYDGMPESIGFTKFAIAIAFALITQITTSSLVGSLLPIGARAAKIDPAVVAAPAITTIVDVTGMVIYFLIAKSILGL